MPQPTRASLVAAVERASARCGESRLVLIDGPAGSGKSTLARWLAGALAAPVVHADDMYEGWQGLSTLESVLVPQVIVPWSEGRPASFRRWDWERNARAEEVMVEPAPVVIAEGVGVAQRAARPWASVVIWVEAPWPLRLNRGIERDGQDMADHWRQWQQVEAAHFEAEGTRAAATVTIDGTAPLL